MKKIEIEWVDTGVVHGWLCPDHQANSIAHCHSIGYKLDETEEGITIAFAISDQGLVMEKKTIPMGCIKGIKELRVK